jgi:hypothetical protein
MSEVSVPANISILKERPLTVRQSWRTSDIGFLLFFTIVWWSGLAFFLQAKLEIWAALFILPHISVGLFTAYGCLTSLFNSTTIVARNREISVSHGPIPGKKPHVVRTHDIVQLYVVDMGKGSFALAFVNRKGQNSEILEGLSLKQARFLESKLEDYLSIEDIAVEGEAEREAPLVSETLIVPEPTPPKGLKTGRKGQDFYIEKPWLNPSAGISLLMCIAGIAWSVGIVEQEKWAPGIVCIGLLMTIVCAYIILALLLNRTRLAISGSALSLTQGPLPWKGNRTIPLSQVSQLFVMRHCVENSTSYSLNAQLTDSSRTVVWKEISDLSVARFCERALERELDIENLPVEGELD